MILNQVSVYRNVPDSLNRLHIFETDKRERSMVLLIFAGKQHSVNHSILLTKLSLFLRLEVLKIKQPILRQFSQF